MQSLFGQEVGALSTKLDPVFKTTVLLPTSICPVSPTSRLQERSGCGILVPGSPSNRNRLGKSCAIWQRVPGVAFWVGIHRIQAFKRVVEVSW